MGVWDACMSGVPGEGAEVEEGGEEGVDGGAVLELELVAVLAAPGDGGAGDAPRQAHQLRGLALLGEEEDHLP